VKRIFRYSGGLPRLINGVCDRALLLAYTRECREVTPSMAALSIADLRKDASRHRPRLGRKALAASLALALIATAAFIMIPGRGTPQAKKVSLPAAPALSRDLALKELAAVSEQDNLYAAVNAVLSAWQASAIVPVQGQAPGQAATLRGLARQRGLLATRITGNLDALARLDAPALLHVAVAGAGTRLIALTAIGKDGVSVAPALGGRSRLSREELAQIWSGGATVLWKDFHSLSSRVRPVEQVEGVKLLQGLLKQVGCYSGPLNGRLSRNTRAAVVDFQRREQLAVDGQATGQTLLLLYRRAGGFFPPGISREGEGSKSRGDLRS
jgi:general secretion pathway protein A